MSGVVCHNLSPITIPTCVNGEFIKYFRIFDEKFGDSNNIISQCLNLYFDKITERRSEIFFRGEVLGGSLVACRALALTYIVAATNTHAYAHDNACSNPFVASIATRSVGVCVCVLVHIGYTFANGHARYHPAQHG